MSWADTLGFDRQLYTVWTQDGGPVEVGAATSIGQYLLTVEHEEWLQEGARLRVRVERILTMCAEYDPPRAERESHEIITNALIAAEDEWDRRADAPPAERPAPVVSHISAAGQKVVAEAENPLSVIPTPFPTLNHYLLGGFRAGELIYLGGRPSTGKSALATEIVLGVARKSTRPCVVISCEMTIYAVCRRLMAQQGKLDAASLRSGQQVDFTALAATMAEIHDYPVWLTDQARTLEEVTALLSTGQRFEFVVVDYLQLLTAGVDNRRIEIERISAALKQLAVSRGCTILALSSLTRLQEGHRPTLAALRESGNLEHDADIVLFLHRKDDTDVECIVAKNRDGRTGSVQLNFRPKWVGFDESTGEPDYGDWHD